MITLYLDQKETSWFRRKYQLTEKEYQDLIDQGYDPENLVGYLYACIEPYDEETVDGSIESMEPADNNGEATIELIQVDKQGKETTLFKNA